MIRRFRIWLAWKIHPGSWRPRPPGLGRPMHEFFELGWHNELNRKVANPEGVMIGFYLNQDPLPDGTLDDGLLVHGWEVIPVEQARKHALAPDEATVEREAAWRHHIAEVRQSVDQRRADMPR